MLRLEGVKLPMDQGVLSANFTLKAGERVAIIGPSGAGKSTLLDAIAGFRPLQEGHIFWQDQALTRAAPQQRPVSILFQDGNLFDHLSLERNLALALRPDGRRLDADGSDQVAQALTRVGLEGMGARLPGSLSGGQIGRAALARVLLMARPVLLLDEPFAALGPALKAQMLDLVGEVVAGIGALCLLVTHDPADAMRFADQVIMLDQGKAAAPVAVREFFDAPPKAYLEYVNQGHENDP